MGANRKQILSEVVSLEAWHPPFSPMRQDGSLHVDAVFLTGRFGGPPHEVRFQLGLKRAEIVVLIADTEPVSVPPGSVSRDSPPIDPAGSETRKIVQYAGADSAAAAHGGAAGLGATLRLGLEGRSSRQVQREETIKFSTMSVIHDNATGDHRWVVASPVGCLNGRPWDALNEPRLTMRDRRPPGSASLPPGARIEVRCLREDLVIIDPRLTNELAWERIRKGPYFRNKVAAAEGLIRTRLCEEGLLGREGEIADPYARLTLATVQAQEADHAA